MAYDMANLVMRIDSSDAVEAKQNLKAMGQEALAAELASQQVAKTAKLAYHEVANLTFQLNDVFVGLASGQTPMTVFMQQGAQIGQILGTREGGIGAGLAAVRSMIPGWVVGVGAMATATGLLGKAMIDLQLAEDEQIRVSVGVGRRAGLTARELEAAARQGAAAGEITINTARGIANALASTGKIGGDAIADLVEVQRDYAFATGRDSKEATEALGRAFADPVKGAAQLNEELGFLNATQMDRINQLMEEGRRTEAQTMLANELQGAVGGLASEYGGLKGSLQEVAQWASTAWTWLGKVKDLQNGVSFVGWRGATADDLANPWNPSGMGVGDRVFDLGLQPTVPPHVRAAMEQREREERGRAQLAQLNSASAGAGAIVGQINPDQLSKLRSMQNQLQAGGRAQLAMGEFGEYQKTAKALDEVTRAINTYLPPAEKAHKLAQLDIQIAGTKDKAEKGRLTAERERVKAAGEIASAQEIETRATDAGALASARATSTSNRRTDSLRRQAEAMEVNARGALALANAWLESDATAMKAEANRKAATDATRRGTDVEAQQRRQLNLMLAEEAATGAQTLSQLRQRAAAQKIANDNVAAGKQTVAEAQTAMQVDLELHTLMTAASIAEGETKTTLTKIIEGLRKAYQDANEQQARSQLAAMNEDQDYQNELLDKELSLMNATNRERSIAIAQLQAIQTLKKMQIDPNSPEGKGFVDKVVGNAKKGEDLASGQGDIVKNAQFYLQILDDMDSRTQSATANMANAWGGLGKALGDLTSVMSEYNNRQLAIETDRQAALRQTNGDVEKSTAINIAAARESQQAEISHYGNMAAAAKGFFKEKSAGYKAMEVLEKGLRAVEFAMAIQSMVVDAQRTASSVANSAIRATADGSAAMAKTASSVPFPFNLGAMGMVAAALAVAGVAVLGGGASGSVPGENDAEDRQKAQGTGSVFGDMEAKSNSVANSIEQMSKAINRDLEYSSETVRVLRSIESGIGAMATVLVRSMGSGGAFSADGLNLGTTSQGPGLIQKLLNPVAAVFPGLFGSKTTRTLQDQGLQFTSGSLSDILNGGLQGQSYQQVLENTKKKAFGFTYSEKNSTSTTATELDAEFKKQATMLIDSMRSGVLSAAGILGMTGAQEVLNSFQVNLGKISFKDMTGEEIQEALNAVFGKLGDEMAAAILPGIEEFQKVGEGALETLTRVARGYQVVDTTLKSIGMTFPVVGVQSIAARERLLDLAGGIEEFADKTADYAQNFLTEQEQMLPVISAVAQEMARLGYSTVDTKDEFKALVSSLDLSTEAGAATYAALMAVGPAFAKVADYMNEINGVTEVSADWTKRLSDARQVLTAAYRQESSALQDTINKFKGFADSLKKFREQLDIGPSALLSPEEQYRAQKELFERTAAAAQAGDPEAMANLQSVSEAYLNASRDYYASSEQYFADLARVKAAVDASRNVAQQTADTATQQLDQLKELVKGYIKIDESVLSVRDALANYVSVQEQANSAIAAAIAAAQQAAQQAANNNTQTPAANDNSGAFTFNAQRYAQLRPDVVAEYQQESTRDAKSKAYLASLGIKSLEDFLSWHWNTEGKQPFAEGGIFTNGIVRKRTSFHNSEMGEFNPEAVVPLVNTPSGLGVSVSGAVNMKPVTEALNRVADLLEHANAQRGFASKTADDKLDELTEAVDGLKQAVKRR